jgi:hypothetical protein
MKVKIYDMLPYYREMILHPDYREDLPIDELIRHLGFASCQYICDKMNGIKFCYWGMDEIEFTWFALKYSG